MVFVMETETVERLQKDCNFIAPTVKMHGKMQQHQREEALAKFHKGEAPKVEQMAPFVWFSDTSLSSGIGDWLPSAQKP